MKLTRLAAIILLGTVVVSTAPAEDSYSATFGELRTRSTIHSIGIEWDIDGDSNHNAACQVRFRKQGNAQWRDASALLRIDYRGWYYGKKYQAFRHFNMLAGSVMFLEPGTSYEVEFTASDPDAGESRKTVTVGTRSIPVPGKHVRTLHVVPGNGGGDGTQANPFKGIEQAQSVARPGDTFLLHAGKYAGTDLTTGGKSDSYIVWKPAGDGEVIIIDQLNVKQSHVWIEGLTFQTSEEKNFGGVHVTDHGTKGVVVVRNRFRNCRYALSNQARVWTGDTATLNTGWYFADNVVDGGPWTQYGTRVYLLADSDVCYNRITTTHNKHQGDAVSLRFCTNVDVYNNDIRDIADDGIEPDSSYANIRIYHNRIVNPRWHGVSFQPMLCSPWYIIRNEFVLMFDSRKARPFKTNVFDRTVLLNNTFVVRGRYAQTRADILLRAFSRNNLWIYMYDNADEKTNPTGALWLGYGDESKDQDYVIGGQTMPDWNTDVDYDGFSWEGEGQGGFPFWWDGTTPPRFGGIESFAATLGIEKNATRVEREETFEAPDVLSYSKRPWATDRLLLKEGCNAIDAGAVVPNLCEDFTGKAPDLGAHEFGKPAVHYGPR